MQLPDDLGIRDVVFLIVVEVIALVNVFGDLPPEATVPVSNLIGLAGYVVWRALRDTETEE